MSVIEGSVSEAIIDLSGSSGFDGERFRNPDLTISCSGGGDAIVWVEDSLEANLSGGSTLKYYGAARYFPSRPIRRQQPEIAWITLINASPGSGL